MSNRKNLDYWTWTCHKCGWYLTNRNTVKNCDECGAHIRCAQAGGHSTAPGGHMCENDCGYDFRTGQTDFSKRRAGY